MRLDKLFGKLAEEARYRVEVLDWEVDASQDESVLYVRLPDKQVERYGLTTWPKRQRGEHKGMFAFMLRRPDERNCPGGIR